MRTRTGSILASAALVAVTLAVVTVAEPSGAAAPALAPSARSVAVGASLKVTAPGCEQRDPEGEGPTYTFGRPEIALITGTGSAARLAAIGEQRDERSFTVTVPGWVDASQTAVLTGRCVQTTYDDRTGTETSTISFTYADVAIDVTPGPASVRKPVFTLDRTTAAGGQVITVSARGCAPKSFINVAGLAGGGLAPRGSFDFVTFGSGGAFRPARGGSATIELALNTQRYGDEMDDGSGSSGAPLPEGDYVVLVLCNAGEGPFVIAEPQRITVVGTNPSGAFRFGSADGTKTTYEASGEGCTGGRIVTVTLEVVVEESIPFADQLRRRNRALARGSLRDVVRADDENPFPQPVRTTATATPAADGSWSVVMAVPDASFSGQATADCGDAHAAGFRYVSQFVYEDHTADVYVSRTSPTTAPTGSTITAYGEGQCDGVIGVQLLDRPGSVLTSSTGAAVSVGGGDGGGGDPAAMGPRQSFTATVRAPATAGRYFLAGTCGDERGYPQPYEVFAPTQLAPASPLPADPSTGWPSVGPRETYHGRIGPITLPAMTDAGGHGAMGGPGASIDESGRGRAMGPSSLGAAVPRPDGNFAITGMRFELVDASGKPVEQHDAHLHHFVVGNVSKKNPACPQSTFGLPGEIVAASGAERTAVNLPDPYGIVVNDRDQWAGVYELMNKVDRSQEVYITYDLDIRRDVDNVRPVSNYFGSATGCSTFTWNIDGSGTPDVQSGYVTIAKDGELIGAGSHIHNGGLYTDLTDDRGRLLCRSQLLVGPGAGRPASGIDAEMDHGGMGHDGMDHGRTTATTAMAGDGADVGRPFPQRPPEFYPDDPRIADITQCRLREKVTAGERLRFDVVYANERARSAVMGIYSFYVWEGGGPAGPGRAVNPSDPSNPGFPSAPGARPRPGHADYTG